MTSQVGTGNFLCQKHVSSICSLLDVGSSKGRLVALWPLPFPPAWLMGIIPGGIIAILPPRCNGPDRDGDVKWTGRGSCGRTGTPHTSWAPYLHSPCYASRGTFLCFSLTLMNGSTNSAKSRLTH